MPVMRLLLTLSSRARPSPQRAEERAGAMTAELEPRLFGSVERRLFRATAVLFTIVALVLLIALVVWALAGTLSYFYKLVLPLSVAGILALVLYPVVDFLEARLRLHRAVATGLIVMLFLAIIVGAVILLCPP
jgi:hypothetical protein